jgi:site-specific recombinase XerD
MNEAGMDIKALAAILGHKDVKITLNTYTDATEEFKASQVSAMDQHFKNQSV